MLSLESSLPVIEATNSPTQTQLNSNMIGKQFDTSSHNLMISRRDGPIVLMTTTATTTTTTTTTRAGITIYRSDRHTKYVLPLLRIQKNKLVSTLQSFTLDPPLLLLLQMQAAARMCDSASPIPLPHTHTPFTITTTATTTTQWN